MTFLPICSFVFLLTKITMTRLHRHLSFLRIMDELAIYWMLIGSLMILVNIKIKSELVKPDSIKSWVLCFLSVFNFYFKMKENTYWSEKRTEFFHFISISCLSYELIKFEYIFTKESRRKLG